MASVGGWGGGDGLRFILNQLVSQQESENGTKKLAFFSLRYLVEQEGILGLHHMKYVIQTTIRKSVRLKSPFLQRNVRQRPPSPRSSCVIQGGY